MSRHVFFAYLILNFSLLNPPAEAACPGAEGQGLSVAANMNRVTLNGEVFPVGSKRKQEAFKIVLGECGAYGAVPSFEAWRSARSAVGVAVPIGIAAAVLPVPLALLPVTATVAVGALAVATPFAGVKARRARNQMLEQIAAAPRR